MSVLLLIMVTCGSQSVAPRLPFAVPATVVQLTAGLLLGPSALAVLHVDALVSAMAALGMGYLLFTAGLQLGRTAGRGPAQRSAVRAVSLSALGVWPIACAVCAMSDAQASAIPVFAVALLTTLVMPTIAVLRSAGRAHTRLGEFTILAAALGDALSIAVILATELSVAPAVSAVVAAVLASSAAIAMPQRGTVRLAIRQGAARVARGRRLGPELALAVIGALAGLVPLLGVEPVLAAFGVGLVWSSVSRPIEGWRRVHNQLDAVGLLVLAPMSFVAAGARIDAGAVLHSSRCMVLVPVVLVAMVLCRAVPAWVAAPSASHDQDRVGAGLLLSTKLTLVVVAVQLARADGSLSSGAGSALLLCAEITVCVFPTLARSRLR
jgi:Kef-type K+ transport system membrane component KefB